MTKVDEEPRWEQRRRPRRLGNLVGLREELLGHQIDQRHGAESEPGGDFELVAQTDRGSQYTFADYTQELDDHGVLASVGSVGDAYDDAMAESFGDTFKTELIADRSWRSRAQFELAVVEYIAWFNHERLHESLGDVSPPEFESLWRAPASPDTLD